MAITYPLDLPASIKVVESPRLIDWRETVSPNRGGTPGGINLARPLWRISYATTELTKAELGEIEAWRDSMYGTLGYFKALHADRKYPLGRPQGYTGVVKAGTATPFDGTGTISAVNTSLSRLTLSGLPATADWAPGLLKGDVVSVATSGGGRQLFRATAAGAGNGSGVLQLDDWVPAVTANIEVGAAFTIVDPWFEAQIDPGSLQVVDGLENKRVQFTATQILR